MFLMMHISRMNGPKTFTVKDEEVAILWSLVKKFSEILNSSCWIYALAISDSRKAKLPQMLTILASDYHPKGLWLDSSQFKVLNYLSRTILRTVNFIKLGAFLGRRFMEYWIKSIFARLRRTVSTKICRSRPETPYGNGIQVILFGEPFR